MLDLINSFASFIQEGGVFMWVILIIWGVGIAIIIERFFSLYLKLDVNGTSVMNEIQKFVLSDDIPGAIKSCSGTKAAVPKVLKGALKRSNQSSHQIQNAIDANALEVIPKIQKRLPYLHLIANISTLFGLLGTIQGLIYSFSAVSEADPTEKASLLAAGISQAMNTTALGLFSAITIMVFHAFLKAKADKIIGEIDEFAVKTMDLLGTKSSQ